MNKTYSRINWQNEPSIATPINETNLNAMDAALDTIDNRVVTFDTSKANQSDLLQTVKTVAYNTETGVFTFTFWNGTSFTADLNIEKIPVDFSMDEHGVITMTTADGTTYTCDIASLIKLYTFNDSSEIDFTTTTDASGNKTITASIVSGSITGDKLQPNYLADCVSAKNGAETAESHASQSARDAGASALDSEAWAVGERSGQPVPSSDPTYENNAKWWALHGTGSSFYGLSDTNFTNLQDGQIAKYDSATGMWVNTEDEGGLLPHFKITSEAGSTVTVVLPDGVTTITPTQTSSGIWQCDVPAYGVYTVHAVINGDDAVRTVTVDTVKEYVIHDEHYSYTLNVYAPTGSSIVVTDGDDETYSGTGSGSTAVIFALHQASTTYTITVDYDLAEKIETITSSSTTGGSGSKTFEFGTINATVDDAFIGTDITCSLGGTVYTKTATTTSLTFHVPTTGTWVIAGEVSGTEFTVDANVVDLGTPVNVVLESVPDGETVLPTDDIQIWLRCAEIRDKQDYHTLGDVLADEEVFEALLSNTNACNYMARSKTWAGFNGSVGRVPTMTSNTTPSGECIYSSEYNDTYGAYHAFDNDSSISWNSTVPDAVGSTIGYDFGTPIVVNRVRIKSTTNNVNNPTNVTIQGYDTEWHDIVTFSRSALDTTNDFDNNTAYTKYRMKTNTFGGTTGTNTVGITILQFYSNLEGLTTDSYAMSKIGKYDYCANKLLSDADWCEAICNSEYFEEVLNVKVPKMTSATAPSGTVFASTYHSGFDPYKAFDQTSTAKGTTAWLAAAQAINSYCGYDFGKTITLSKMSITHGHNQQSDKDINVAIQYSNDNQTWNTAKTVSLHVTTTLTTTDIAINPGVSGRYFRIYDPDGVYWYYGSSQFEFFVNEIQFYGRTKKEEYIPLVPIMTSDTTPSGTVIYHSQFTGYDAYKVFNGQAVGSSNRYVPVASELASEFYLGYKFDSPEICNKAEFDYLCTGTNSYWWDIVVQGSNDNDTWETLSDASRISSPSSATYHHSWNFENNTPYLYYRWKISDSNTQYSHVQGQYGLALGMAQFYRKARLVPLVPVMSGDTTPCGEVVYSSQYDTSSYPAWKAFDGDNTTSSMHIPAANHPNNSYYLGYKFPVGIIANRAKIYAMSDSTTYYYDIAVYAGNSISNLTKISNTVRVIGKTITEYNLKLSENLESYEILVIKIESSNAASAHVGGVTAIETAGLQFYQDIIETQKLLYGAASDAVYYMDGGAQVDVGFSGHDGTLEWSDLPTGKVRLYSSVAKDPSNLSNPYSKEFYISENTTELYFMPDDSLYWWGNQSDDCEDATSANGWSGAQSSTYVAPTHNANDLYCNSSGNYNFQAIVTKQPIASASKIHSIMLPTTGAIGDASQKGYLRNVSSKSYDNTLHYYNFSTTDLEHGQVDTSNDSNFYIFNGEAWGAKGYLKAFWYDRKKTPTLISAANDTIYEIVDGVTNIVAETDANGCCYEPLELSLGQHTLYSTVAKDPNNLSNDYSKSVTITADTMTVKVIPDGTIINWFGYGVGADDSYWTAGGYRGISGTVPKWTQNTNNMSAALTNIGSEQARTNYRSMSFDNINTVHFINLTGNKKHGELDLSSVTGTHLLGFSLVIYDLSSVPAPYTIFGVKDGWAPWYSSTTQAATDMTSEKSGNTVTCNICAIWYE